MARRTAAEESVVSVEVTGKTGATARAITLAGGTTLGPPTTGAHVVGEIVTDNRGKRFYCITAGTPGVWVSLDRDVWFDPVWLVITTNVANLNGGAPNTIDGFGISGTSIGARILVVGQTNAAQNGIYRVVSEGTGSNGVWVRDDDMPTGHVVTEAFVLVRSGNTNGGRIFQLPYDNNGYTVGTTNQPWAQFTLAGGGGSGAANGITYDATGNTFVTGGNVQAALDQAEFSLGLFNAIIDGLEDPRRWDVVKVPQLFECDYAVWGHSLTVPWYPTIARQAWPMRFASGQLPGLGGTPRFCGVGGYEMEDVANIMGGGQLVYAYYKWVESTQPTVAQIMATVNSAGRTNGAVNLTFSINSFVEAAKAVCARVLGNHIPWTDTTQMSSSGTWTPFTLVEGGNKDGQVAFTTANGAYYRWTVPTTNTRGAYIVTYNNWTDLVTAGSQISAWVVRRNGVQIDAGNFNQEADYGLNNTVENYNRVVIPTGPVTAGDTIDFVHNGAAGNVLWFDGIYSLQDLHQVQFIKEPPLHPNGYNSAAYHADFEQSWIDDHFAGLVMLRDMWNAQPGMANSVILVEPDYTEWDAVNFTSPTDDLHWNDRGHAFVAAQVSQWLRANMPWTNRLHAGIR